MLGAEALSRGLLLGAAFAPGGSWYVMLASAAVALGAIGSPLINGLYGTNFRVSVRGKAVGRLQTIYMGSAAVVSLLAGMAIKGHLDQYRWVLIGVATVGILCSRAAYRLPEARPVRRTGTSALFREFLAVIRTDRAFMYMEAFWFIVGICNIWLIPIRVLYLAEQGYNPNRIMWATTPIMLGAQLLTVGLWGRVIYKMNFSHYRMIVNSLFLAGIGLFFFSGSYWGVCLGSFVCGLGSAGGELSWRLAATFFTHPRRVPIYMTVHTFLCGVRGLIGPIISLTIREWYSAQTIALISMAGLALSILMLAPLGPAMERRRKYIED
ncbi:MAG: Major Facilitator Superfamily protein [candidate division BRC1 bacterium ADurb.BinA364]|nr:MAG: Major Facilitator Superfamily protein [candidate division BRC1 bacterium ADurb.BinA364]